MASTITNLDDINVWKTKSEFNYNAWQENITIKLCQVPWDKNDNVVGWRNNDDRRSFFQQIDGYVIDKNEYSSTLNTLMGTERIRVNLPYINVLNYNYLAVYGNSVTPPLADVAKPIDRFYFIDDARQVSPSVSELTLSLDLWGTYSDKLTIDEGHLTRGHLNSQVITPIDFLGGQRGTTKLNTEPEPININTTWADAKFISLDTSNWNTDDKGNKWKNRLMTCFICEAPLNYDGWTDDGYANIPVSPSNASTGNVDGLYCYAVPAVDTAKMVDSMQSDGRPYLKSVRAVFSAMDTWLTLSDTTFKFYDNDVYEVTANNEATKLLAKYNSGNLIDPSQFMTTYYKAYEGQFCPIDIFYGDNFLGTFGLENTATELDFYTTSSIVYPYIDFQAFFTGLATIGVRTETEFSYRLMNGNENTATISSSDWERTLVDLEVPIFSVAERPLNRWAIEHDPAYATAELNATNAKNQADASNDTAKDNGIRSANLSQTIGDNNATTARDTSNASNDTSKVNADAYTNTARTNADNGAKAGRTNADNAVNTSKTNADASNDTSYSNSKLANSNTQANSTLMNDTSYSNENASIDQAHKNAYSMMNAQNKNSQQTLTLQHNTNIIRKKWQKTYHTQNDSLIRAEYSYDYGDKSQVKEEMQHKLGGELTNQAIDLGTDVAGQVALTAATGGANAPNAITSATSKGISMVAKAHYSVEYTDETFNLLKERALHERNNSVGANDRSLSNFIGLTDELENGYIDDNDNRIEGWRSVNENMNLNSLSANQTIADGNQTVSNSNATASHTASSTVITNNKSTSDTIADASHDTASSNIARTATTSLNANALSETTSLNANELSQQTGLNANKLSHDTTASNITASYNNSINNNKIAHDVSIENIDASHDTTANNINISRKQVTDDINLDRKNALNQNLISDGMYGGNYASAQMGRRYYKFVTRYPSQADQDHINKMFERFGYTWDEYVDDVKPTDYLRGYIKFMYWKMDDIKFTSLPLAERYRTAFRNDLGRGVRIWDAWLMTGLNKETA